MGTIVVLSDGEAWDLAEDSFLAEVDDSQFKKLVAGYYPKQLKLRKRPLLGVAKGEGQEENER